MTLSLSLSLTLSLSQQGDTMTNYKLSNDIKSKLQLVTTGVHRKELATQMNIGFIVPPCIYTCENFQYGTQHTPRQIPFSLQFYGAFG